MHESSIKTIVGWYAENYHRLHDHRPLIADLGSLDINGRVSGFIPEKIIGFDILPGDNIDVVIKPGIIPDEHKNKYGAVISANVFHLCGDIESYRTEVRDLLDDSGLFILTMCKPDCTAIHNTSQNEYGFRDGIRMSAEQLKETWKDILNIDEIYLEGHDLVLKGSKK